MADQDGKTRGLGGGMAAGACPAAGACHHHQYPPPPPPPPQQQQQQYYGTFQGVPDYSRPAIGFPQPVPPAGVSGHPLSYQQPHHHQPYPAPAYYTHGYQAVPGYAAVAEGTPLRMPHLPCCGIGVGWFLFIFGFFLAAIPWYVGAFILLCVRIDYREKPGFIACTIAAVLSGIAVMFGVTKGADAW